MSLSIQHLFNIYIAIKYFRISKIKLFIVLLSDFDEKDVDKKNMVSKYAFGFSRTYFLYQNVYSPCFVS